MFIVDVADIFPDLLQLDASWYVSFTALHTFRVLSVSFSKQLPRCIWGTLEGFKVATKNVD